eukprot:scaffold11851_cov35-Phaeocystis_antarctica.AAC.1
MVRGRVGARGRVRFRLEAGARPPLLPPPPAEVRSRGRSMSRGRVRATLRVRAAAAACCAGPWPLALCAALTGCWLG